MTRGHRGSLPLRCRALSSPSPCRFIPALPIDQNGLPDCVLPIRAPVPDQPNLRPTPDRARPGVSCLETERRHLATACSRSDALGRWRVVPPRGSACITSGPPGVYSRLTRPMRTLVLAHFITLDRRQSESCFPLWTRQPALARCLYLSNPRAPGPDQRSWRPVPLLPGGRARRLSSPLHHRRVAARHLRHRQTATRVLTLRGGATIPSPAHPGRRALAVDLHRVPRPGLARDVGCARRHARSPAGRVCVHRHRPYKRGVQPPVTPAGCSVRRAASRYGARVTRSTSHIRGSHRCASPTTRPQALPSAQTGREASTSRLTERAAPTSQRRRRARTARPFRRGSPATKRPPPWWADAIVRRDADRVRPGRSEGRQGDHGARGSRRTRAIARAAAPAWRRHDGRRMLRDCFAYRASTVRRLWFHAQQATANRYWSVAGRGRRCGDWGLASRVGRLARGRRLSARAARRVRRARASSAR